MTCLSLAVMLAQGLYLESIALAQGSAVKPKPRKENKPEAVQPKEPETTSNEIEDDEIAGVKIGVLPFFSATDRFDDEGIKVFNEWFRGAVDTLLDENAFGAIEHEWIEEKKIKDKVFEKLPTSRIRGAADLLKPLAKKDIEGIVGSWVESKPDSDELVVVFYLPERIALQDFKVSANFERATLKEEPEVGYEAEPTQALMVELLRRNLRRVTPISGPAHTPPANPPPASGIDTSNDNGNDPKGGDEKTSSGGSGGPKTFAVLDYSWELSQEDEALDPSYTRALKNYPFRDKTTTALRGLVEPRTKFKANNVKAIGFDQIEAPVIDLDPNADPKEREKALFARAGPDADALVFGHIQRVSDEKQATFRIVIRLLSRDGFEYFKAYRDLPKRRKLDVWTEDILQFAAREVLEAAGFVPPETVMKITVLRGESASSIARKCYGSARFNMELVDKLCRKNGFRNLDKCGDIERGSTFKVPKHIDRWTRNDARCQKGRPRR